MNQEELKKEEKIFTTKYMLSKYNFKPTFIDSGINIPDCYFQYGNKVFAVEVTRYFQQNFEKDRITFIHDIEKYFQNDFFKKASIHLGKKEVIDVTIAFRNIIELKTMIIQNIKYIKNISIDRNYFDNVSKNGFGEVICINTDIEKMTISRFMNYVTPYILEEKEITIELFTKNKHKVFTRFQYCKSNYYGIHTDKKVIPLYAWFVNEDELYDNIVSAIKNKNDKLKNEYIEKLNDNNIKYDYYNLVLYNVGLPASLNKEILFNKIKAIEDLKFNEIAIFLWGELMVVNKDGFQVYRLTK